jgi:hypothetical protein
VNYMLEFTPGKMRVYEGGELVTVPRAGHIGQVSSYASKIQFVVVDWGSDLTTGDIIQVAGLTGVLATALKGSQRILLETIATNQFYARDAVTGAYITRAIFTTYTESTNTIVEEYALASPYVLESDLDDIRYRQIGWEMYLSHYRYQPRKLTGGYGTDFAIGTYSRTNDPFASGTPLAINGITRGTTTLISFVAEGFLLPQGSLLFAAVVGTTEINGGTYELAEGPYYNQRYLVTAGARAHVNSSEWTAYTSGGTATPISDCPVTVDGYESRLVFAGTNLRPTTLFLSMAPSSVGILRPDTFTGGTAVDNACFFSLAPVNGAIPVILWSGGTTRYLLIGTFGGVFRVSGGGTEEPITPSSINMKQIDAFGCEAAAPAITGNQAFFIQRGGVTLRGIRYDVAADDFASEDMCVNADQIGISPFRRCILQTAFPDTVWVVREDGVLCGMTVHNAERIAGWHRHKIGGTNAKVLDVAVLPRDGNSDQLYVVTERTINGSVQRAVEVMTDGVSFPDVEDFYSGAPNHIADRTKYRAAVYRRQEQYIHMDAAVSYDGSDRGTAAAATLTPASIAIGAGVVFTASAAVFTAADVGKEIWRKPDAATGVGTGRAVISSYGNTTQVTCEITEIFDVATAIPAGDWYFAVKTISGISHLEGEVVSVVADGAVIADGYSPSRGVPPYDVHTVASGAITLDEFAAVVHVGLPYEGLLQTQNLEIGGRTGPAQTKPRNIVEFGIRFLNSLGCEYGTDPYNTEQIVHRDNTMETDRPVPVFSGIKKLPYSDTWSTVDSGNEKTIIVAQRLPLPCTVQFVDIQFETGDE